LFVADGSIVPSSIGFHPAMTIAALAEQTATAVLSSFR
jgi:cholesterol oxidase